MEVSFARLVFGFCSVWLPAPVESRTNEKVAYDTAIAGVQPLILELRYTADGSPLIETATVRLLHAVNTGSPNLPHPLNPTTERTDINEATLVVG